MPPPGPTPLPPPAPPKQVTIDAVMGLLRDSALRRFRIDIEADSTVSGDESQERQDRTNFIESTVKLLEAAGPMVQGQPILAPLLGELLQFGVRSFRVGRSLEEVIDETVDKLDAFYGQPKPPAQPSPDELVKLQGVKAKADAEIQKAQLDVQSSQAEHQAKIQMTQIAAQEADRKSQRDAAKHVMDMQAMQAQQAQQQQDMAAAQLAHAHKLELMQLQHEHAVRHAKEPPRGRR